MKPADDELIAHIKESLAEHEEMYVAGAWENFNKKERRGRRLLWLGSLSSAAAVFLIGFAFFYTVNKTNHTIDKSPEQVPQSLPLANQRPDTLIRAIRKKLNTTVSQNVEVTNQRKRNNVNATPLIVSAQTPENAQSPEVLKNQIIIPAPGSADVEKQTENSAATDSRKIATAPVKEEKQRTFQEFLADEVKTKSTSATAKSSAKKESKWEMGVVVAPSIGNSKKLNMGYGLSMGYAITDKISVNSGISYNEMGASKAIIPPPNGAGMTTLASESKSLQSVDASLVGIDIPLEIKYYITKKIYTNVGVSAFAVLDQKHNNNYLQGRLEDLPADKVSLASPGFKTVFKETKVSEPVPSGEIKDDKYLGFYNISFGYKQKISGNKALSVEPFMKLPVKEFTKENMYLIGTGVRLKFDF